MRSIFTCLYRHRLNIFHQPLLHFGCYSTLRNIFITKLARSPKKLHLLRWTTFIAISLPFTRKSELKPNINEKLNEADVLFENGMYSECLDFLASMHQQDESGNVEILWRMSRALYKMSNNITTDSKKKQEIIFEAYELIKTALERDPDHYAVHKWMAILLDLQNSYIGIKHRIVDLETVKNHMLTANELNPKDATVLYMLGEWCFQIASMPRHQRFIASSLFATPPKSSYEEALQYFLKAEQTEPRFYISNLFKLGETYLILKEMEKAKYYLELVQSYPAKTSDDIKIKNEAKALLASLKTKS